MSFSLIVGWDLSDLVSCIGGVLVSCFQCKFEAPLTKFLFVFGFLQIRREIATMKLIKHPHVVQLHEVMKESHS